MKTLVDAARRKPGELAAQAPVYSYVAPGSLSSS